MERLESEIAEWRSYVEQGVPVRGQEVEELETHLRDEIADLVAAGLAEDEAFLIGVKRIGTLDELSREFAREHSGRLWRQFAISKSAEEQDVSTWWPHALGFALAAAFTAQIVRIASGFPVEDTWWLPRNASLFVAPFLAVYFARRHGLGLRSSLLTVAPFAAFAVVINLYPLAEDGSTHLLVAAHLPVVAWFLVAYPYMGGIMRSDERRMNFVRFTGEWLIYYVLIALGGGVLMAMTVLILEPTGIDVERVIWWVLPSGIAGAVIVAAWLVESKQRVVENMAPVLTMIFTPLFAIMLAAAVVVYALTGLGRAFDRELLGVFDALLVVVLALVLYGMSARDPSAPPGWMDRIQLVTVFGALLLDLMMLGVMVARIGQLGFTPNRTAALGLNVVLLVNLVWTAWLSTRFLTGHSTFHRIERWQTAYLPVLAVWAATVVVVLPPLFDFA